MIKKLPRLKSIYYENDTKQGLEYKMVELALIRDIILEKVKSIITSLRVERGRIDDDTFLEVFQMYNQLRDSTIILINHISKWQRCFTKLRRPFIKESDYLLNIIESVEILCTSKVNKLFNFNIERGNILILPIPIGKFNSTFTATDRLRLEIDKFINPNISDVVATYQILWQCLPSSITSKFTPIEKWGNNKWKPILLTVPITTNTPEVLNDRTNSANRYYVICITS